MMGDNDALWAIHNKAMDLAETAFAMKAMQRDIDKTVVMFREAAVLELQAARMSATQPTVAILYRSAAWLAYDAKEYDFAVSIVDEGIQTDSPMLFIKEMIVAKNASIEAMNEEAEK